jgi:putative SOS response-associated peptidase YedK
VTCRRGRSRREQRPAHRIALDAIRSGPRSPLPQFIAKTPGGKQPYCIGFKDGRPFALAGLWERWKDRQSGEKVETFTIITGPPNEVAGRIHNRMPVIIDPADFDRWLTAQEPPADLLKSYPADEMAAYPVSKAVNSPALDEPSLIEPLQGA